MFPVGDWQFWVATGVVAVIVAFIVRAFWPKPRGQKRATLTVKGKSCKH